MAEIDEVRRQGYGESRGKMIAGANTISMLVPLPADATPLAIGVGGPMERIDKRRDAILAAMRRHLSL